MRATTSIILLVSAALVAATEPLVQVEPQFKPAPQSTIQGGAGPFNTVPLAASGSYDPQPLKTTTTFSAETPAFNTVSYATDSAAYYSSLDASIASASAAAASASEALKTATTSSSLIVQATGTGRPDGALALGGSASSVAVAGVALLVGAAALL